MKSLLIDAWREEAQKYRRDGKEQAAMRLERMADKVEKLKAPVGAYHKPGSNKK